MLVFPIIGSLPDQRLRYSAYFSLCQDFRFAAIAIWRYFGYASMIAFAIAPLLVKQEQKELRTKLDNWTGLLLFMGGTAMIIFSGYLIYLLVTVIQAACVYCIASALLSTSLFVLSVIRSKWEDIGKLFFTGALIATLTTVTKTPKPRAFIISFKHLSSELSVSDAPGTLSSLHLPLKSIQEVVWSDFRLF